MARLEDLRENARVRGLVPEGVVTIQRIAWIGDLAVQVLHR